MLAIPSIVISREPPTWVDMAIPALRFFHSLRGLPVRFKRYLAAVRIFGIGEFSHSVRILAASQLLTASMGVVHAAQAAGLLYVWRNVVQAVISFPVGFLADRFGQFVSSTGVGVMWTVVSPVFSFALAATIMAIGTICLLQTIRE
jgi:hypothetical protein